MESDRDTRTTIGLAFGGLAPIAVALAFVPLRAHIDSANAALVLTLVVVAGGALGGRAAGAAAAGVSALAFDFFYTKPYLSLTIASGDDVETTVLLLLVGLSVGTLSWRLRNQGDELAVGRSELGRLSRVANLVARGEPPADVLFAAQTELSQLLDLRECRFEADAGSGPVLPRLERSGVMSGMGRVHHLTRQGGFELPESGIELPVLAGGRPVGRFVLLPRPGVGATLEGRVVAVALADQVGAALAVRSPLVPAPGRRHQEGI